METHSNFHLLIFLCLLLKTCMAGPYVLQCIYNDFQLSYDKVYQCNMQNDFPFVDETVVSSASGDHSSAKNNDAVTAITIYNKNIFQIPNFITIFKNINYLYIRSTSLRYLKAKNLEVYKQSLKHLEIIASQIEAIEKDLFKDFNALKTVDLQNNHIFYIHEEVFDSLDLEFLKLRGNECKENSDPKSADIGDFEKHNTVISKEDYLKKLKSSTCKPSDLNALLKRYQETKTSLDFDAYNKAVEHAEDLDFKEEEVEIWKRKFQAEEKSKNNYSDLYSKEIEEKNRLTTENTKLRENSTSLIKGLEIAEKEIDKLKDQIKKLELTAEKCMIINGTCRFVNDNINGYSCIARNISINSPETDIEWTGDHTTDKLGNRNVITLKIEALNVEYVPIKITTTFVFLQTLIISKCGLKKLSKNSFSNFYFVSTIQLTSNNISAIDSGAFDDAFSLETLDLSDNKIKSLPLKIFTKLDFLHTLKLDKNLLTSLKADFIANSNKIKFFSATNNNVEKVDSSFVWKLRSATLIDLSRNSCDKKYDKTAGDSYIIFYTYILSSC